MRALLLLLGRGRVHIACIGGASVRTRAALVVLVDIHRTAVA